MFSQSSPFPTQIAVPIPNPQKSNPFSYFNKLNLKLGLIKKLMQSALSTSPGTPKRIQKRVPSKAQKKEMATKVLMDLPRNAVLEMKRKKQARIKAAKFASENGEIEIFKPKNISKRSKVKILGLLRKSKNVDLDFDEIVQPVKVDSQFSKAVELRRGIDIVRTKSGFDLLKFDATLDKIEELIEKVPTR